MKTIIKFSRDNCAPCKMMSRYLDDKEINYVEVNVEEDVEKTVQYGISSVPTLLLLDKDGSILNKMVGFNPPLMDSLISQI